LILQLVGYLVLVVVWAYLRIHALLRKQKNKEAAIYGGLLGLSALIGSLLIADVDIPSANLPFEIIFEPIGKIILTH
jgi:hypothetical protein